MNCIKSSKLRKSQVTTSNFGGDLLALKIYLISMDTFFSLWNDQIYQSLFGITDKLSVRKND